jgi:hypothetical protein
MEVGLVVVAAVGGYSEVRGEMMMPSFRLVCWRFVGAVEEVV